MPKLRFTLKAWPVITAVTIGLCFLTQAVAKLLGFDLPEQTNVDLVRNCLARAFVSWKSFGMASFLVAQVLIIMPAIEECVFRWGLYKLPVKLFGNSREPRDASLWVALISSALFSAAHYLAQPWPDNAFLALFFFGLAQCWLYRKTGKLWSVMLNHALFNLANLVLLFILPPAT